TFPRVWQGLSMSPLLVTWFWLDSPSSPCASQSIQYQAQSLVELQFEHGRVPVADSMRAPNAICRSAWFFIGFLRFGWHLRLSQGLRAFEVVSCCRQPLQAIGRVYTREFSFVYPARVTALSDLYFTQHFADCFLQAPHGSLPAL